MRNLESQLKHYTGVVTKMNKLREELITLESVILRTYGLKPEQFENLSEQEKLLLTKIHRKYYPQA